MSGRTDVEEAVKAADAALEHARNLPPGPDRSAAIKEAGKLRTAAERLKRHAISTRGRRPEAIRRLVELGLKAKAK